MNIVKASVTGLSWTASATLIRGLLQIGQLMILARFLTPLELGLMAVINIVIGFAQIFGEAGISNAVIYHKSLNKHQLNQLYIVNVGLGVLVCAIVVLMAFPLAQFFSMTGLASLLILLSPVFLIRSLCQQQMALLQQKMRFDSIAKIELGAAFIAFLLLVFLLNIGFRLESVVLAQLANATLISATVLLFNRKLLPGFSGFNLSSIVLPLKYGLYQSGERVINFFSAQLDEVLVGKLLGAEVLGIYAYVKNLVFRPAIQLINPIVNSVAFPLMVNFKESYSAGTIYSQVIALLSMVNIPLYLLMASFPKPILYFAFGADWVGEFELLRWLALYMLFISLINPIGVLLRATGEVKRGFWWNVLVTIIRSLLIVFSISSGTVVLVKTLVLAQVVFFLLHWLVLLKPIIHISLGRFVLLIIPPIVAFTAAALVFLLINYQLWPLSDGIGLGVVAVAYSAVIYPKVSRIIKFIRTYK
jgi:O-antigen/teichoic acid export membrane protein